MQVGKVGSSLSYMMQLLIICYVIYSMFIGDYLWASLGLVCFLLTQIPMVLERRIGVIVPSELKLLITLVLYLHVAGNVRGWYDGYYPVYDKVTHFLAATLVAALGFIAIAVLDPSIMIETNGYMAIAITIIFTTAMGAFWEIGEFLFDRFLGTRLQHGLTDTMLDMVFDFMGGCIASFIGNIYLRRKLKEDPINLIGIEIKAER